MHHAHFDTVTRALAQVPSRRDLLRGLTSLGLGLGAVRLPAVASARKKRKHKKRQGNKAKPNAFGCLEVGDSCQSEEQCCSGICDGKKGKRKCRAHDAGTCTPDMPGVCGAPDIELTTCNYRSNCGCFRTTAGSNFCGSIATLFCNNCQKDADCLAQGLPPGTACVPVTEGVCDTFCQSDMACVPPCGAEIPG